MFVTQNGPGDKLLITSALSPRMKEEVNQHGLFVLGHGLGAFDQATGEVGEFVLNLHSDYQPRVEQGVPVEKSVRYTGEEIGFILNAVNGMRPPFIASIVCLGDKTAGGLAHAAQVPVAAFPDDIRITSKGKLDIWMVPLQIHYPDGRMKEVQITTSKNGNNLDALAEVIRANL